MTEFQNVVRSLEDGTFPADTRTDIDTASLLERHPLWAAVETAHITIPGRHGDIPGRIYRRTGAADTVGSAPANAALVWVHGGAWIGGTLEMPESNAVAFAVASAGTPVLALDYRKALNGTRYPVPSDDVVDGWNWAVANAHLLHVDTASLHLGGASAGGDLVAGVALRLQDCEGVMPASVVLAYALVHAELPPLSESLAAVLAAHRRAGHELGFDVDSVREMTLNYVGDPGQLSNAYAFAANAEASELATLPPVFVLNSEVDLLRASGEAFAAQLTDAGATVRAYAEAGAPHGHLDQPHSEWFERSIEELVDWLRAN